MSLNISDRLENLEWGKKISNIMEASYLFLFSFPSLRPGKSDGHLLDHNGNDYIHIIII